MNHRFRTFKLLFRIEVRWLSRGRSVEREFELREELSIFLQEHNVTKLYW